MNNYTDSGADILAYLEALNNDRVDAYKGLQQKVSSLLYQRKGLIVEVAGAAGYTSADNTLDKTGLWANASYYVSSDDLFTFTARYLFNNRDTTEHNTDIGLSFLQKKERYNISVEAMLRSYRLEIPDHNISGQSIRRLEKSTTYRIAVQGSYSITDYISFNLSFGKDFDSPFITGSSFFSILGFNYSLFSKEIEKLNN